MLPGTERRVIVIGVEMQGRGTGTPGGARLRALREGLGRTQLWVEAEAELGSGYVQRVESGKVIQPSRVTVERILSALGARYSEQREVLELFGYVVHMSPPSAEEIAWARAVSRTELEEAPFPAYVLDCTHTLIAWNGFLPRLLGVGPDDPLLAELTSRSLLAAWFDPTAPFARMVVEPERFLPAMIRALRYEVRQFYTEPWYAALLGRLAHDLPRFRHYWEIADREPARASAARALVPVRLNVPNAGVLQFRLSSERFTRDARFRVVYFFPADPVTMAWSAED